MSGHENAEKRTQIYNNKVFKALLKIVIKGRRRQ